ncbi:hypothetical protein [Halobacillus mangrovi]|uniref:hypothetical protein n=1 Tax=Halobacillus mangrovi TaxID=402384 RepID=UPI003D9644C4
MIVNFFAFCIFPWFIVIFLLKIDLKIVLLISPFASMIACIMNTWTIAYGFADVYPFETETHLASLPMIVGVVPALSSLFVHLIQTMHRPLLWIPVFIIGTTSFEGTTLLLGLVDYDKGWNIIYTSIEYTIGYCSVYGYFMWLKSEQIV